MIIFGKTIKTLRETTLYTLKWLKRKKDLKQQKCGNSYTCLSEDNMSIVKLRQRANIALLGIHYSQEEMKYRHETGLLNVGQQPYLTVKMMAIGCLYTQKNGCLIRWKVCCLSRKVQATDCDLLQRIWTQAQKQVRNLSQITIWIVHFMLSLVKAKQHMMKSNRWTLLLKWLKKTAAITLENVLSHEAVWITRSCKSESLWNLRSSISFELVYSLNF